MIALEDKLFHAVVPDEDLLLSQKLELEKKLLWRIFSTNKIMCRNSLLQKYYDDVFFSRRNYNGGSRVSLSKHISKQNEEDNDERYVINQKTENAWQMYPFSHIALVLNAELLEENKKYLYGPRIPFEVQVEGDISLKYLEAVSFPVVNGLLPFFEKIEYPLSTYLEALERVGLYDYWQLEMVLDVLFLKEISVPLVNISTGNEYHDNIEYRKLIRNLKK